jgi:hypothetical protein
MSIMQIRFVAYNYRVYNGSFDQINVSVNHASTMCWNMAWIILRAAWRHQLWNTISAACIGNNGCDKNATMPYKWVSTARQWVMALHLGQSTVCAATFTHTRTVCGLVTRKLLWQHHCSVLNMSSNGASTIIGFAPGIIKVRYHNINP